MNDASPVPTASFNINVSWSKMLNPLTFIFSPAVPDIDSLSDKPCLRIYFGSVRLPVVSVSYTHLTLPTTPYV